MQWRIQDLTLRGHDFVNGGGGGGKKVNQVLSVDGKYYKLFHSEYTWAILLLRIG